MDSEQTDGQSKAEMECSSCADGAGDDEKASREDRADRADRAELTSDDTGGLVGTVLDGCYEIMSLIGSGTTAVLYKAKHQLMGRIVAIKMLRSRLASNGESLQRFQQEAKALCGPDQRDVSRVFDYGVTEQGRPYLVMEYTDERKALNLSDSYAVTIAGQRLAVAEKKAGVKNKVAFPGGPIRTVMILLVVAMIVGSLYFATDAGQLEAAKLLLKLQEMRVPADDPGLIQAVDKVGRLSLKLTRYEDAVNAYRRESDSLEQTTGLGSAQYADSLVKLAAAWVNLPPEKRLHDDRKKFQSCVNGLIELTYRQNDNSGLKKAIPVFERAFKLAELSLDSDDELRLRVGVLQGNIFLSEGKNEDAVVQYKRVFAAAKSCKSPQGIHALRGVLATLVILKRFAEAEEYCRILVAFETKHADRFSKALPGDFNMAASVYAEQHKFDQAELLYKQCLYLEQETTGPISSETLTALDQYARFLVNVNKFELAMQVMQDALQRVYAVSPDRPEAYQIIHAQSIFSLEEGDRKHDKKLWNEALRYGQRALAVGQKLNYRDTVAESYFDLGEIMRRLGKMSESEGCFRKAISTEEGSAHPRDWIIGCALRGLASSRYEKHKFAEAEDLGNKAVEMLARDGKHPSHLSAALFVVAQSFHAEGDLLHDLSKYKQAEGLYKRRLRVLQEQNDRDQVGIADCQSKLGQLYEREAELMSPDNPKRRKKPNNLSWPSRS